MFLRKKRKIVRGESYEYWNLCESIRTERGPRQRVVASLCKMDDEEVRQGGWEKIGEFRDVRRVFSTSAVDNKIYVFGGRDVNYGTLQDWDCFDCDSHEWESVAYDQLSDDDKKRIDSRRYSTDSNECMVSCDSMDSLVSLTARSPETRTIPRAKFYGGQAITLPAEKITW